MERFEVVINRVVGVDADGLEDWEEVVSARGPRAVVQAVLASAGAFDDVPVSEAPTVDVSALNNALVAGGAHAVEAARSATRRTRRTKAQIAEDERIAAEQAAGVAPAAPVNAVSAPAAPQPVDEPAPPGWSPFAGATAPAPNALAPGASPFAAG